MWKLAFRGRAFLVSVRCLTLLMLLGQPMISAAATNAPQPCCVVETSCRDQGSQEPTCPCKKSCPVCLRGDCCQAPHYLIPESRLILSPHGHVEEVVEVKLFHVGRNDRPLLPPPKMP